MRGKSPFRLARRGFLASLLPAMAQAQGFAGLGHSNASYAEPDPEARFRFPEDHGPHPAFRIEWWYVTANLTGPDGAPYGVQWTLFRSALDPNPAAFAASQAWLAHAALTTPTAHFASERRGRGGTGQAGVTADPFAAWLDDWSLAGPSFDDLRMRAASDVFAYDLRLRTGARPVPQGIEGYSVKSFEGTASHYYSQPFYEVEGALTLPDGPVSVTGKAWLDREWSSSPLSKDQEGWDWFSLHLGDGAKLMGFQLRDRTRDAFTAATWIGPDGTTTPLPPGAFTAEPLEIHRSNGREIPVRWRVTLPQKGVDVTVTALNPNCWMPLSFPYWEGPVTVAGTHDGVGYLEMTGYE
ncbi:lipocalin-like domain-containing protein [Palleronia caenipelagi]|uniref:Iron ABC transporter permease n=1 Tax=Palleronia caenipelagi TaxID=2489174 RepID=A0A547QAE1_9RHOB|nr:lipocalin-like domain-containing protein [Palleronia caenipelagi]TRD23329.1 iron ABC transporter permease [Palleronia caenipelagi]